ncbi:TPA: helix-turn-helix transcriptional regulator [Streptococcus agalactiae]|nr:helix-turn-helix transcriptional regulator [Streptococcus agalactiae]
MYIRIRNLREDNDLTQKEVAELLHCSQSAYSRIESGVQDVPTKFLKKLAEFYHVTIDYLLEVEKDGF